MADLDAVELPLEPAAAAVPAISTPQPVKLAAISNRMVFMRGNIDADDTPCPGTMSQESDAWSPPSALGP